MYDNTNEIIAIVDGVQDEAAALAAKLAEQQREAIERMDAIANEAGLGYTYTGLQSENERLERSREWAQSRSGDLQAKIDSVEEWLKESLADEDIPEEVAESLADMLGIELTEESVLTLTVEVRVTHKIGARDRLDDGSVRISIDDPYYGNDDQISIEDWEVTETEVREG